MPPFSNRHQYAQPPGIGLREELPSKFRSPLIDIAARQVSSKALLQIVEHVLNPYGINPQPPSEAAVWSSVFLRTDGDLLAVRERISGCPWFRVYDIVEEIHKHLVRQDKQIGIPVEGSPRAPKFEREINKYFVHAGIGWQLAEGQIVMRGDVFFEGTTKSAVQDLVRANRPTAAGHLKSALLALSEREKANTAGAVSQATSSVECILGEITGEAFSLGKYLDRYPRLFHSSLKALDGIYGYASDAGARHGKEGIEPSHAEAVFIVATCAAVCALLTKQRPQNRQEP